MRRRIGLLSMLAIGLLGVSHAEAVERPVVVELFTSEGCSSCPPADALLTELARTRSDLLPLAFHVTYWNYLGWTDPFSLEAATQRQKAYGAHLGGGSYTPEMVVDGTVGVVGSDRGSVEAAIRRARATAQRGTALNIRRENGRIMVHVGAGNGSGRILLVGFDREHRTSIGRGENTGRTLVESNIVRSIRPIGQWTGSSLDVSATAPAGEETAVLLVAPEGRVIGASSRP